MLEPELCSSRVLSPFREESGDEELSVLPRHTKVIVTGNNRTKSVLVGLQGVVKKAVGLGGWHWLVFLYSFPHLLLLYSFVIVILSMNLFFLLCYYLCIGVLCLLLMINHAQEYHTLWMRILLCGFFLGFILFYLTCVV